MRLIDTTTLKLCEYFDNNVPPYAILSHTWGAEEVSYQELLSGNATAKQGYEKIARCCEIALSDGFEYAWVDTCCIDKTSSAELSEAINSIYRWYQQAHVCYAFLSDVPSGEGPELSASAFRESRWFTRGWTLQELIAPTHVIFYNQRWREIGTKSSLSEVIAQITFIPRGLLTGTKGLHDFSILRST